MLSKLDPTAVESPSGGDWFSADGHRLDVIELSVVTFEQCEDPLGVGLTADTWIILVHGNGMTREDAVRFALDEGASEVVLFGYSMGGGVVASFLYESALADEAVSGLILDVPMLDFGRTVDFRAGQEKLPVVGFWVPQSLTSVAKWMAGWRFDVNWSALDYLDRADELNVPILLFHGTADEDVPSAASDDLAAARPDLVTYRPVGGAGHMESWNVDSAAYETAIVEFLTRIAQ